MVLLGQRTTDLAMGRCIANLATGRYIFQTDVGKVFKLVNAVMIDDPTTGVVIVDFDGFKRCRLRHVSCPILFPSPKTLYRGRSRNLSTRWKIKWGTIISGRIYKFSITRDKNSKQSCENELIKVGSGASSKLQRRPGEFRKSWFTSNRHQIRAKHTMGMDNGGGHRCDVEEQSTL